MTMAMVMIPAKMMSLTKWRPKMTRMPPTAAPKTTAAPMAVARTWGGASEAGATTQKAWLASPETKEQLRLHSLLGRHQGWKSAVPAN